MARLAALAALAFTLVAAPADARPSSPPTVDLQDVAGLAPDSRSVTVQLLASCAERATVLEASVKVAQGSGSGSMPFTVACSGFPRYVFVTVPAAIGSFSLGAAQVTAALVTRAGKTQRAEETQSVAVEPRVAVELAASARVVDGGSALEYSVGVACPVGTTGRAAVVGVTQGNTSGSASFVPLCDGATRTLALRIVASRGTYVTGVAQALSFVDVEWEGRTFTGIDDDGALELES